MSIKNTIVISLGVIAFACSGMASAKKEVISGSACQAYREADMAKNDMVLSRSEWGLINRSTSKTVSIFCPMPSVGIEHQGAAVAVFHKAMDEPTKCWLIASTNIEKGEFRTGSPKSTNPNAGLYWLKVKADQNSTIVLKCNLKPQQMIRTIHVDHSAYPRVHSGL